jgi:hypothetical protein
MNAVPELVERLATEVISRVWQKPMMETMAAKSHEVASHRETPIAVRVKKDEITVSNIIAAHRNDSLDPVCEARVSQTILNNLYFLDLVLPVPCDGRPPFLLLGGSKGCESRRTDLNFLKKCRFGAFEFPGLSR